MILNFVEVYFGVKLFLESLNLIDEILEYLLAGRGKVETLDLLKLIKVSNNQITKNIKEYIQIISKITKKL